MRPGPLGGDRREISPRMRGGSALEDAPVGHVRGPGAVLADPGGGDRCLVPVAVAGVDRHVADPAAAAVVDEHQVARLGEETRARRRALRPGQCGTRCRPAEDVCVNPEQSKESVRCRRTRSGRPMGRRDRQDVRGAAGHSLVGAAEAVGTRGGLLAGLCSRRRGPLGGSPLGGAAFAFLAASLLAAAARCASNCASRARWAAWSLEMVAKRAAGLTEPCFVSEAAVGTGAAEATNVPVTATVPQRRRPCRCSGVGG